MCRAISAGLYALVARRQYSCVTVDAACLPDEDRVALLQQGGWLRIIATADGAEKHAWRIGAMPAPTSLAVWRLLGRRLWLLRWQPPVCSAYALRVTVLCSSGTVAVRAAQ